MSKHKKRPQRKPQSPIMFYVPSDVKRAFKTICDTEGAYMSEKLNEMILIELGKYGIKTGLRQKSDNE